MEVETKPAEIENLDRRIIQLKFEREAPKKEQDKRVEGPAGSSRRSSPISSSNRTELTAPAGGKGKDLDRSLSSRSSSTRPAQARAGAARRRPRQGRKLQYGRIPQLEKQIADAQAATKGAMLREEVTEEDIAAVVSRWTGIPVERMMEGEREKLLQMDVMIGARVIGQDEAVKAVSAAVRRARAVCRTPTGRSVLPVPRPHWRRQDRAVQGAGRIPLRQRRAIVRIDMSEFMEKHAVGG